MRRPAPARGRPALLVRRPPPRRPHRPRPVHSLLSHTVGEAYEQLVRLAPADEPFLPPGREPSVRHCDEYAPRDGVVEAFARISSGDRVHALAFRLERGPDLRWRCAAVEADGRHRERAEP
ncbi:Rv3235 family protein [Actinomadura keratinilytica]